MKPIINYNLRDKFKGKERKILFIGIAAYSFSLIGVTTLIVKGGFVGRTLKPILNSNLLIPLNYFKSQFVNTPLISLDIKHKNVLKIKNTRDIAKEKGYLMPKSSDWVSGIGSYGDNKFKYKIRLKGLLDDHWDHFQDGLWSYKLKLRGEKTLLGMKRFAIQHPRVRNYMDEWYFHKLSSYSGLIAPRFTFSPLSINGKRHPVYSIEENFGKRMIENNKKREGPIFMLSDKKIVNKTFIQYPTISFYQKDYYLNKNDGAKLIRRAERLINSYYADELNASDVFDLKLIAKAFALADLFGHDHSVLSQNIRFYINPVTGLIEPIPFDNSYILRLRDSGIIGEHYYHNVYGKRELKENNVFYSIGNGLDSLYAVNRRLINKLLLDQEFSKDYINALSVISQKEWLDIFFSKTSLEAKRNLSILHKNYPWYKFNKKEILYKNQNYIASKLRPESALLAFQDITNDIKDSLNIRVANNHTLPVEIVGIANQNGKILIKPNKSFYLSNRPRLCTELDNCLDRKNSELKYKDLSFDLRKLNQDEINKSNLTIVSKVIGTSHLIKDNLFIKDELEKSNYNNISKFSFISIDKKNNIIDIKPGNWVLNQELIIPKGFFFKIGPSTRIDLINNSYIKSYSPVSIVGTKESPINITSTDKTGEGLIVKQVNSISNIKNVNFSNLKSLNNAGVSIPGSVTFYESDVIIDNVSFSNNQSEDAINIIRSKVEITNSNFNDIYSDAIDLDFCFADASNLYLSNIGNDGIDVSGTEASFQSIKMYNLRDKGISIGEESKVNIKDILIDKSYIGIASKDSSIVNGKNINISNSYIGLASYQKKSEYGPSQLNLNDIVINQYNHKYFSENNSIVILDSVVLNNNINDFYKNIYGTD